MFRQTLESPLSDSVAPMRSEDSRQKAVSPGELSADFVGQLKANGPGNSVSRVECSIAPNVPIAVAKFEQLV